MYNVRNMRNPSRRSLPGSAGRTGCPLASSAISPYSYGILEKVLVDGGYITAADMRYHFFVTDHLGNVRVVVNDAGVVEQVNQFYPYGEATDMGQALPASVDNPYKWGGKEWDEDQGAYDFGARMYSAADARWTTMDPLSEKYYHISPYAYCAGDPVNLVDPDGMDIWEIDENGAIFNRIHDETADTIYLVRQNENGNYERIKTSGKDEAPIDIKISFPYGTISSDRVVNSEETTSFKTKNNEQSEQLFQFFADNLKIEVGLIESNKGGYTIMQGSVDSVNADGLAKKLDDRGIRVFSIVHSHPNNHIPSGFSNETLLRSDKIAAGAFPSSQGFNVAHFVYTPIDGKCIRYDSKKLYEKVKLW